MQIKYRIKMLVVTLTFVAWTLLTIGEFKTETILWEGLTAAALYLAFIYCSKCYGRQWVYYVFIGLLVILKYIIGGYGYFFYLIIGTTMFGFLVMGEINNNNKRQDNEKFD